MEDNDIKIDDDGEVPESPEEQVKESIESYRDFSSIFENINSDLEAIEADLAGNIPDYKNCKKKVDPDAFKLCVHYIMGAGSPVKEKYPIKSKINQDYKKYEEEVYNQEEGDYMENEQYEEAEPIENDEKYKDAILQQKFWGGPITSEYRTEMTYQSSSNSKPELDIVSKYRAKYS